MSNASSETINSDLSLSPFPKSSSPTSSPDLSEKGSPLMKSTLLRSNESQEEADARQKKMADAVRVILECIGEDPTREGLLKTPDRYAKALLWLTRGYTIDLPEVINDAVFEEDHGEIVLVRDIGIESLCEHHLVPFVGKVSIAYIPNGAVIGLSKLARIAETFGRRLQVQERLTKQIAQAVCDAVSPTGVAVTSLT